MKNKHFSFKVNNEQNPLYVIKHPDEWERTLISIGRTVVAQLVEQLLPTPETRSLNPTIGNFFDLPSTVGIVKTKIKKKETCGQSYKGPYFCNLRL